MTAHLADAYLTLDHPGHIMFIARLGLTIAELAVGHSCASAVTGKSSARQSSPMTHISHAKYSPAPAAVS
jgi:hypothetical protein